MSTYFDIITPDKAVQPSQLRSLDLRKARPSPGQICPAANSFSALDVSANMSPSDKTVFARSVLPWKRSILRKSSLPEKVVSCSPVSSPPVLTNKKITIARLAIIPIFILVTLCLLIGGGAVLWPGVSELIPDSSVSANVQSVDQQDVPEDLPVSPKTPTIVSSWRLHIPAINLDTAIEEVGLTPDGNMAVPNNYTNVGWFKQGPKIGQPGTAVLAGHLNRGKDKPAVFWDLQKLKAGDYIYIADDTKPKQRFRVTAIQNYDVADAPLDKIYTSKEGAKLNLITCSGKWDKNLKDYTKRLVVFTELAP